MSQTLRKLGDRYFDSEKPPLDWQRFRQGYPRAFYYDAVPVMKIDEDSNSYEARVLSKKRELAAIERQDGYYVRTGDARYRKGRGSEQKMVDVQLAVDALSMASRSLFSWCTILTSDLNFKPLITALVEMGIHVHLLYPSGNANALLVGGLAADAGAAHAKGCIMGALVGGVAGHYAGHHACWTRPPAASSATTHAHRQHRQPDADPASDHPASAPAVDRGKGSRPAQRDETSTVAAP